MENRWKPHVTVAAVIERNGAFLLVEEDTFDGVKFNIPAGHLDPGESPLQACTRETLEEAAYDFQPTALLGIYLNRFTTSRSKSDVTYLRFAFTGILGMHHPERALDTGIVRAVWMTPDEIRQTGDQHRSPMVLECMENYLSGQHYPLELIHTHPSIFA